MIEQLLKLSGLPFNWNRGGGDSTHQRLWAEFEQPSSMLSPPHDSIPPLSLPPSVCFPYFPVRVYSQFAFHCRISGCHALIIKAGRNIDQIHRGPCFWTTHQRSTKSIFHERTERWLFNNFLLLLRERNSLTTKTLRLEEEMNPTDGK